MNFIRNHKKISISILVVSILFLFFGTTFARYVYNVIHNHILESKEFYFNSSVLDINNKQFRINNWDGVNNYVLTIDVNNQKNSLKFTNSDIKYQVEVSCPENVECQLSKTEGIIYKDKKTDSYQITVIPKEEFYEGDEVEIMTKATSIVPSDNSTILFFLSSLTSSLDNPHSILISLILSLRNFFFILDIKLKCLVNDFLTLVESDLT